MKLIIILICCCELGFSNMSSSSGVLGGIRESGQVGCENSVDEIHELAKFAVEEHNKKQNGAVLELARVVKAKTQLVSGTIHHLTLEVLDAGNKVVYEAKVWVKPWENFKQLQEFTPASDQGVSNMSSGVLGGIRESQVGSENSVEIDELAKFAVDEHNKKENAVLEFLRVVKAKTQAVSGTMHHLTLEVLDAGNKVIYEAKIWVKPWENFKQLQEFKHAPPAVTPSDLGLKQGGHEPGWRTVPAHDPAVKDAADHAVKTLQQRSNSLAPFELLEIILAKAEVIDETAKFDLLLKMKRGCKEEKYKVEVHRNLEGTFQLNQMEQDHS